jgi:hypothetical protein
LESVSHPSVDQKVAWLALLFPHGPPADKAEVPIEYEGSVYIFKVGSFWKNIKNNWTGYKAMTSLTPSQKQELEGSCSWIPKVIASMLDNRSAKPHGEPSVDKKLAWFAELFQDSQPPANEEVTREHEGAPYRFRVGLFWFSIAGNWTGDKTSLSPAQKQVLDRSCSWIPKVIASRFENRSAKPHGEPAVDIKVSWLADTFPDSPPPHKKELVRDHLGVPYRFKVGLFWDMISGNWTGDKASLTPSQKQVLEGSCSWIPKVIASRLKNRSAKPHGEPSVDMKVSWLGELFPDSSPPQKEVVDRDYKGAPFSFRVGSFWNNISGNWTGDKTSLTPQQKSVLDGACSWIPNFVASRLEKQNRRTKINPS